MEKISLSEKSPERYIYGEREIIIVSFFFLAKYTFAILRTNNFYKLFFIKSDIQFIQFLWYRISLVSLVFLLSEMTIMIEALPYARLCIRPFAHKNISHPFRPQETKGAALTSHSYSNKPTWIIGSFRTTGRSTNIITIMWK